MPNYQNSSVSVANLIIGNCKIETAPYGTSAASSAWTNLGAGIVNSFKHVPTKYSVQAGNAPDPIEGVATEIAQITGELIEYNATILSTINCGLISATATSSVSTIIAGGNSNLTPVAFRITNKRIDASGTTKYTTLTVFKATLDGGPEITFKSDNDTDPIAVMPFAITAKLDTSLSAGTQLYTITRDL